MLLSHYQNAGPNWDIKIANRSFENVSQLKYLGRTVTNENLIQEEIKRRLNSGNACYHSVQNLLSSCLLSKNVNIRIFKTIILPVVLYGCATWSLTLREERRLRVRWVEHVASRGEKQNVVGFWWVSQIERDHKEYVITGGRIILRCIHIG
jgi:hypothetical protein